MRAARPKPVKQNRELGEVFDSPRGEFAVWTSFRL